jgi:hypothetical protein
MKDLVRKKKYLLATFRYIILKPILGLKYLRLLNTLRAIKTYFFLFKLFLSIFDTKTTLDLKKLPKIGPETA